MSVVTANYLGRFLELNLYKGIALCVHQDIPTGADSCVTSLSCDSQRSLIVAGLGDGSVRVFDRRMGPNEW